MLHRVATANTAWTRRTASRAWSVPVETRRGVEEDLQQDLALHLWEQFALRGSETWEIFFHRALQYAQRHVATAYMIRNGYWHAPQSARPSRGRAALLSQLASYLPEPAATMADTAQ